MKNLMLTRNDVSVLKQSIMTYVKVLESLGSSISNEAEIARLKSIYSELEE